MSYTFGWPFVRRKNLSLRARCWAQLAGRAAQVESLEPRTLLTNGHGLTGYYFDQSDFGAARKFLREDDVVDFNWASGKPDGLNGQGIGVRWAGRVMPKFSESYRFYTRSTGGVRLWVNGQLIIDDRTTHPLKDNKGTITLQAGVRYDLRLEFTDTGTTLSTIQLQWASNRQARETIPTGRLFAALIDATPPGALNHLRPTYMTDTAVKLMWDAVPATDPAEQIVYGIYLGGTKKLAATTNTSYTRSGLQPDTAYSLNVRSIDFAGNVTSGAAPITTAHPYANGNGSGIAGAYFASTDFNDLRLTRTDPTIEFAWVGAPFDSNSGEPFSARWEGKVQPKYDELYTFYTLSDDGVRLWVDGKLVIDHWTTQSQEEHTGTIVLKAGQQYDIKLDYFNDSGAAAAVLSWSSLSQRKQVIPASQLFPAYVDTQPPSTPQNLALVGKTDSSATFSWNPSSDNIGVVRYVIYRDGASIATTNDTQFTDNGLTAGTLYQYNVASVDGVPLTSAMSANLLVTTDDPAPRNAFSTINATTHNASTNITITGGAISGLDNGDWVKYSRLDFGSGAQSWRVKLGVTTAAAGGSIELRLNSPTGQLIGTLLIQPTGSYSIRYWQQVNVSGASGVHDLYLVIKNKNNVAQIESFQFSTQHLVRVMPLGDSITEGNPSYNSYRYYLWHKLLDAGYAVDFVGSNTGTADGNVPNFDFDQNHEGHSGWRADEVLADVHDWVADAQPDIVLLHLGTNDIWAGQSASSTAAELGQIIDAIRSVNPNIKIVLAQLVPFTYDPAGVDALNALIPGIAAAKTTAQSPVLVVDMSAGYSLNGDSLDGVHPNNSGSNKMANKWYDALTTLLA